MHLTTQQKEEIERLMLKAKEAQMFMQSLIDIRIIYNMLHAHVTTCTVCG